MLAGFWSGCRRHLRLCILRTSKCVDRTIWRRWSGYHRRSRAETRCDLRQAARAAHVRAGFRPSGCRVPGACRRPERLHRAPHTHHPRRRISPSRKRGLPAICRFVQQDLVRANSQTSAESPQEYQPLCGHRVTGPVSEQFKRLN